MKFDCKEISIIDEEFGCTLTFSENVDDGIAQMNMTTDELMNSSGKYLMLQRTYPEDEFDKDYYYIEMSDFDKSGEFEDFTIDLYRRQFLMTYCDNLFEIGINIDDKKFENLMVVLAQIVNKQGILNFHV